MNNRAVSMIMRMGLRAVTQMMASRARKSGDPQDRARAGQMRSTGRRMGQAQRLLRRFGRF